MTTAPMAPPAASGSGSGEKGLKGGALGLVSSIVVGMASTAPAYSLAASLGFANPYHFTRVFRRITGTPPGRWRQRIG